MSAYVQEHIIAAVKAAKGSRAVAERKLVGLCATDSKFLLELVAPSLPSILRLAIDHHTRAALTKMRTPSPVPRGSGKDSIGKDMLKSFAGQDTPVFGFDDPNQGAKRPAASARHRAAIAQIARRVDSKE